MADFDDSRIVSWDDTALFHHRSKVWSLDDEFSLKRVPGGGIDFHGTQVAGVVAGVVTGPAVFVLWLVGLGWYWGLVVGFICFLAGYFAFSREDHGQITPKDHLSLRIDYLFQPKRIGGIGRDNSPDNLHWQLIVYRPANVDISSYQTTNASEYGVERSRS